MVDEGANKMGNLCAGHIRIRVSLRLEIAGANCWQNVLGLRVLVLLREEYLALV